MLKNIFKSPKEKAYQEALKWIQAAQRKSVDSLYLSAPNLTKLPPEIGQLTHLSQLDIHGSQLSQLPPEIGQLSNLRSLDLSDNELPQLPPEIGQLNNLSFLALYENPLPLPSYVLEDLGIEDAQQLFEIYFSINPPTPTAHIFLSYAHPDQPAVELIYQSLLDTGYKPWMDIHSIIPGEDWERAIKKAVENCTLFVACLSENSYDRRGWIQQEIDYALEQLPALMPDDIFIIPIHLDDKVKKMPERLEKLQALKYYETNGPQQLLSDIEEALKRRND